MLLFLSANLSQQKENHVGKEDEKDHIVKQGHLKVGDRHSSKETHFFPPALNYLYPLETVQALDGKWHQEKLQAAKCNYINTREPTKWGESNFKIGLALLKQF